MQKMRSTTISGPEVYVGSWVQMDPSLGQTIADATHIQLGGEGTVESDNLMEFAEGVFPDAQST